MTVYTLFGQPATPATLTPDPAAYTLGMEFSLSENAALTGIWFYSAPSAALLPQACAIYAVSGQSIAAENTSPSWSGAAGSGWVKCTFDGSVTLTAGTNYKVCVQCLADTGDGDWYSSTAHYWDTGAGSAGITNGPLTAPDNAGADVGQDSYSNEEALVYPDSSFNAGNYWIDVEVTVSGGGGGSTGTVSEEILLSEAF